MLDNPHLRNTSRCHYSLQIAGRRPAHSTVRFADAGYVVAVAQRAIAHDEARQFVTRHSAAAAKNAVEGRSVYQSVLHPARPLAAGPYSPMPTLRQRGLTVPSFTLGSDGRRLDGQARNARTRDGLDGHPNRTVHRSHAARDTCPQGLSAHARFLRGGECNKCSPDCRGGQRQHEGAELGAAALRKPVARQMFPAGT
ncbi:hypothetical protein BU26DRAFT_501332 [Trematosphaeria pertusa]|uniref:Uncharacterized protein n=1 Tax=Trematosphaeria pertusa TaxID=390896 RepID=A0A6A6ISJ5_9PLEO|nr:uncharacterized protein BU26DRAFT_501332 [Trematosphaeria pertusa]KAF2253078.1 hypothetical protein BU26DRAFT_501332 [Trematosphaeria pertusa]